MKIQTPVLMARIGAPHGTRGEVRVKSFTGDPLALGDYGSLYANDGRKFKPVRMRAAKNLLIVKFKGINFRNDAESLNGTELFIDRSMLPDDTEEDEFYVTDLVGMMVVDTDGAKIGILAAVPDFGAGDLLEISPTRIKDGKHDTGNWYLEFTRKNVPHIDLENKLITVVLPDETSGRDETQD